MKHQTWSLPLVCTLIALTSHAAEPPHTGVATLACGSAHLQSQTTSIAHVPPDDALAWTAQQLTLVGSDGASHRLQIKGLPDGSSPEVSGSLPVIVSSWQCLKGARTDVIELWLTCNRSDLGGACGGEREWERLIDVDGRPLDAGYAPQDPRYEALSKRLGIPADGIKLLDATGD